MGTSSRKIYVQKGNGKRRYVGKGMRLLAKDMKGAVRKFFICRNNELLRSSARVSQELVKSYSGVSLE